MDIAYSNKKVEKMCGNDKYAKKELGKKVQERLYQRLDWLSAAPNLDFFNTVYRTLRLHKLSGNKDGMYAFEIDKQYRLVFYPCNEHGEPDYENDFKCISVVMIEEVSKHYE